MKSLQEFRESTERVLSEAVDREGRREAEEWFHRMVEGYTDLSEAMEKMRELPMHVGVADDPKLDAFLEKAQKTATRWKELDPKINKEARALLKELKGLK